MRISRSLVLGTILSLSLLACGGSDKPSASGADTSSTPSASTSPAKSGSASGSTTTAPSTSATDGATPTAASSVTPTAGSTSGGSKLTTAQANTLANAGILTTGDYPGSKSQPTPHDADDAKTKEEVLRCIGGPKVSYLTRNPGVILIKGQIAIVSAADVISTVAEAKADFTASSSPKAKTCFEAELRKQAEAEGAKVKSVHSTVVTPKIAGADQAFGYDVTVEGTYSGITFNVEAHFIGVRIGAVELTISSAIPPGQKLSFATTSGLASKATSRVRAAYPKNAER